MMVLPINRKIALVVPIKLQTQFKMRMNLKNQVRRIKTVKTENTWQFTDIINFFIS